MSKEENGLRLASVAGDLNGKSVEQVRDACKRYRLNGENKWFPTSGQLLDLMKNPYADAPSARGHDWHSRLGFGGGGCTCPRCTSNEHREGFYVAPADDYVRGELTRSELDGHQQRQMIPSRLDDAEMHTRFLMTQELVRDHGHEWEDARRKVMVERTRALYPEFKIWPALGAEPDDNAERSEGP